MSETYTVINAKGKKVLANGSRKQMIRKVWKQIKAGKMEYDNTQVGKETTFMDFKSFFKPSNITKGEVIVNNGDEGNIVMEEGTQMEQPTQTTPPMDVPTPEAILVDDDMPIEEPAYEPAERAAGESSFVDAVFTSVEEPCEQDEFDAWDDDEQDDDEWEMLDDDDDDIAEVSETDEVVEVVPIENPFEDDDDFGFDFEPEEPVFFTDPVVTEAVNESLSEGAEQYNERVTEDLDRDLSFEDDDEVDAADANDALAVDMPEQETDAKPASVIAQEMIDNGELGALLAKISNEPDFADELMADCTIPATAEEASQASLEAFIAQIKAQTETDGAGVTPEEAIGVADTAPVDVVEPEPADVTPAEPSITEARVVMVERQEDLPVIETGMDVASEAETHYDFTDVELPSAAPATAIPSISGIGMEAPFEPVASDVPVIDAFVDSELLDIEEPEVETHTIDMTPTLGNADSEKGHFSGGLHPLYDNSGTEICVGDVMSVNSPRERIGVVIALGVDMFLTESDDTDRNGNKIIERWHVDGRREYYHYKPDTLEDIVSDIQDSSVSVESLSERFADVITQIRLERGIIATNHEIGEPSRRRKEPQFLS